MTRLPSRGRMAAAALCLSLATLPGAAGGAPVVEFLHASAGEGGASGGHVALRLGAHAYHFQRDAEGTLVLVRDAWRDFEFRYREVENRTLTASRIALSAESADRLRDRLDARFLSGLAEHARIAALRDDVALLEAFAGSGVEPGFAMRGAGFFALERPPGDDASSRALRELRERIARGRGPGLLEARRREAIEVLRELDPDATPAAPALGAYTFSQRFADAYAAILALDALEGANPLRPGVLRPLPADAPAIGEAERAALRARAEAQASSLVDLVASRRPDWGFAFLLGSARLAALEASLERGRLVVLDVLPEAAARVPLAGSADPAARHLAWRRARLADARAAATASPTDPRALAAIEREAALHGELAAALRAGTLPGDVRVEDVPQARVRVAPPPGPGFTERETASALVRARERLAAARRLRSQRDGYALSTRNCVTELLREIEVSLADRATPLVHPGSPLGFVPFVAARAVERSPATSAHRELPSRRRAAARRARSEGWLAALREASTLTSSLYTPHAGDSIFLFFTDETVLARPLLGVANLAAGLSGGAVGALWLPVDGGATLSRGVRGSLESLPELVFLNVRKGTFPLALPPG